MLYITQKTFTFSKLVVTKMVRSYYFSSIGDVFHFGKHYNQLLCDVLADDPTYLIWCVNSIPDFGLSEQTLEQIKLLFPTFPITETFLSHIGEEYEFWNEDESDCDIYNYIPETYERYSGSYAQDEMGYSDDDIDTIFDGDSSAYWNID